MTSNASTVCSNVRPPVIERVFPTPQSDLELGDAYEQRGHGGAWKLLKARAEAAHPLFDGDHIRYEVAVHFGVSPGDIA